MPQIPIIMPQLGESIAEATIVRLLVKDGDQIEADQDVLEVETNKATMNVATPCPGRLLKFLVKLNESYPVGTVLGYLEASPEDAARLGLDQNGNGKSILPVRPPSPPPKPASAASNPQCAASRCRRTPPAPVTFPRA